MLEIRPNCELCDTDLPANSLDARVCSYECTYCVSCVDLRLRNVCPTCGGGFERRPIRPVRAWRPGLSLGLSTHPAGTTRKHTRWTEQEISRFVEELREIPPNKR
nr:DUF1272 domain-containing protein [Rhizobacter sp. Root404]